MGDGTTTRSGVTNSAPYRVIGPVPGPDLTLQKSHTGNFTVNNAGSYTLTVRNQGSVASDGEIAVTDTGDSLALREERLRSAKSWHIPRTTWGNI